MPIIPNDSGGQRLDSTPPIHLTQDTANARIEGNSLAQFGAGLAQFGSGLNEHMQRQQAADDIVDANKAKSDIGEMITQDYDKAKMGAGDDYVGDYNKSAPERVNKYLNGIQNERVKAIASNYANTAHSHMRTNLFGEQLKTNEIRTIYKVQDAGNAAADRVRQNPETAGAEILTFQNEVLSPMESLGVMRPEARLKAEDAVKSTIATSMMEGMMERKDYKGALNLLRATQHPGAAEVDTNVDLSPEQAQNFGMPGEKQMQTIDSKNQVVDPAMAEVMKNLSPKAKDHFIDRIQSAIKTHEGLRIADIDRKVTDYNAYLLAGGKPQGGMERELENAVRGNPHLSEDRQKFIFDNIRASKETGKYTQELFESPPEKMQAIIDKARQSVAKGGDIFNFANRQKAVNGLEQTAMGIMDERKKDPAGYVRQFPEVAAAQAQAADGNQQAVNNLLGVSDGMQRKLGIPEYRIMALPKQQALELGQKIDASPTPQDLVNTIDGLKNSYGKNFHRVLNEAAGTHESIKSTAVLGYIDDKPTAFKIASNIKDKSSIQTKWDKNFEVSKGKLDMILAATMDEYLGPMSKGFSDGAPALSNAFSDQVRVEVQRRMNEDGPGKLDLNKHVKEVTQEIMGNNFNKVSGGVSQALIPKKINGAVITPEKVSKFLEQNSTPEGFEKLGVYAPTNQDSKLWFTQMAAQSKWVMNPNMDGMVLTYKKDGRDLIAVDKDKKPIEKSLVEINKMNHESVKPKVWEHSW